MAITLNLQLIDDQILPVIDQHPIAVATPLTHLPTLHPRYQAEAW